MEKRWFETVVVMAAAAAAAWAFLRRRRRKSPPPPESAELIPYAPATPLVVRMEPQPPAAKPAVDYPARVVAYLKAVTALLITCVVVTAISSEAIREPVMIEAFTVPEQLVKEGQTGPALANELSDYIGAISRQAETDMIRPEYVQSWQAPDMALPGTGLSLRSAVTAVRHFLKQPESRFTCDIAAIGENVNVVRVNARLGNAEAITRTVPRTDLGNVLRELAEYIYLQKRPFILAAYRYREIRTRPAARQETLQILDLVLRQQPDVDRAYAMHMRGVVQLEQGLIKPAIDSFTAGLAVPSTFRRRVPNTIRFALLMNRGRASLSNGEPLKAIADYNEALKIAPHSATVHLHMGVAHRFMANLGAARADLDEAIRLEPANAEAYLNRGNLFASMLRLTEALDDLNHAIALRPDYASAYLSRATIYRQKSDYARADQDEQRAFEIDPSLRQAVTPAAAGADRSTGVRL